MKFIKERKCSICGKMFVPTGIKQHCCSKKCAILNRKQYLQNKKKPKIKVCPICGEQFIYSLDHRKYCSDKCSKQYFKLRLKNNPNIRLIHNLRVRLYEVLKGKIKTSSTLNLLGCSVDELWIYLESQFQPGMTRENYGTWHIDHIKPCSSFDFTDPDQQKKCFHYTNLQPLWAEDNIKKSNKTIYLSSFSV